MKAGYSYIAAPKTNRVIYPNNNERLGIKLHQFAKSLSRDDYNLVTVNGKKYYIYSYIGKLKDAKMFLLRYSEDSFQKDSCLKTFISLDTALKALDILI